ncbi:MAG: hypothetical protein ACD_20C00003G0009 [uncultured bacterium]|nr:MAG: hypothetical protein ACD_20C00003G0009 [uncultured bacterium]HBH19089.1 hypothetical protein [Cyanobacteria bacterium UBA9579]
MISNISFGSLVQTNIPLRVEHTIKNPIKTPLTTDTVSFKGQEEISEADKKLAEKMVNTILSDVKLSVRFLAGLYSAQRKYIDTSNYTD